eukprot:4224478-Pleurochrysis_carterae.AAC.2
MHTAFHALCAMRQQYCGAAYCVKFALFLRGSAARLRSLRRLTGVSHLFCHFDTQTDSASLSGLLNDSAQRFALI